MKTEITFIRHGETKWNNLRRYQGVRDIELNKRGYEQARKVRDLLRDREIDCIYTSNLIRARATAGIIAEYHDVDVSSVKELREINFGEWEGMHYQEIEEEYPQLYAEWKNDPTKVAPPGGDLLSDFQKMAVNAVEKILSVQKEDRKILIISHGGTIRLIFTHYLGMPLEYFWRIVIDNVSINEIIFFDGTPIIKSVNCTTYLEH